MNEDVFTRDQINTVPLSAWLQLWRVHTSLTFRRYGIYIVLFLFLILGSLNGNKLRGDSIELILIFALASPWVYLRCYAAAFSKIFQKPVNFGGFRLFLLPENFDRDVDIGQQAYATRALCLDIIISCYVIFTFISVLLLIFFGVLSQYFPISDARGVQLFILQLGFYVLPLLAVLAVVNVFIWIHVVKNTIGKSYKGYNLQLVPALASMPDRRFSEVDNL